MTFTPEQLTKAKSAKTAEELLTLAKESGIEMTEDEAAKYFADLNKEGELADDELANVSGGCGDPDPKYHVGDKVELGVGRLEIIEILEYNEYRGYLYRCVSLKAADRDAVYKIYEDQFN